MQYLNEQITAQSVICNSIYSGFIQQIIKTIFGRALVSVFISLIL